MTNRPPDQPIYDLFNLPPEPVTEGEDDLAGLTSAERFERFHEQNPAVYVELVSQARTWRHARPRNRLGMDLLFARLR